MYHIYTLHIYYILNYLNNSLSYFAFYLKLAVILYCFMIVLGFILALFIGMTLGLVGSGGSILTVPVFVYVLHVDPNLATTYSLFAIAVSSSVGSVRNFLMRQVRLNELMVFGLPSVVTVFITRQFILPLIPDEFKIGPWVFHQNSVLMFFFGVIMLISAYRMIRSAHILTTHSHREVPMYVMALQGAILGVITGGVGAGGGFLIIPALVNFYKMPIAYAVPTSLAIISLNSIFGLAGDLEKIHLFDWTILGPYTLILISGMFCGFYMVRFFAGEQLKKGLGYLILVIGIYVLTQELVNL